MNFLFSIITLLIVGLVCCITIVPIYFVVWLICKKIKWNLENIV